MKIIKYLIICPLLVILIACGSSPAIKTVSFKVWGNCGMCKKTIEKSLKADGIESANWNKDTKIIEVSFDTTKVTLDEIHHKIAGVGYDTEQQSADEKAYQGLHSCCKYERK